MIRSLYTIHFSNPDIRHLSQTKIVYIFKFRIFKSSIVYKNTKKKKNALHSYLVFYLERTYKISNKCTTHENTCVRLKTLSYVHVYKRSTIVLKRYMCKRGVEQLPTRIRYETPGFNVWKKSF